MVIRHTYYKSATHPFVAPSFLTMFTPLTGIARWTVGPNYFERRRPLAVTSQYTLCNYYWPASVRMRAARDFNLTLN